MRSPARWFRRSKRYGGAPATSSRLLALRADRGQRNRRADRGSRPRARADVQPSANNLRAFGHRQQAVAAHLVAAERMLEGVETDSVIDDFEASGVLVDGEGQLGPRRSEERRVGKECRS